MSTMALRMMPPGGPHGVVSGTARAPGWHHGHGAQRGQALTEMLLIGGLLVLCWHAFEYLHHMRERAFQANQAARLGAFALAAGAPATHLFARGAKSPVAIEAMGAASPGPSTAVPPSEPRAHRMPSSFVPSARAIAADWLAVPPGMMGARARLPLPAVPAAVLGGPHRTASLAGTGNEISFASAQPQRRLLLVARAGHAPGMAQTQQRLGRSRSAWRAAADRSIALSRQVAAVGEPVDKPWHARKLNTDWLAPWSDLIRAPGDRGQP